MTSDDFAKKCRLLRRITRSGVQSFNAQEAGTGRVVMAHCLVGGTAATYDLLARVQCLPAADRARVIECADVDGTPWVVTEVLPGFSSFESWLDERVAPGAVTPPAQPTLPLPRDRAPVPDPAAPPVADPPGEFTRFFRQSSAESTPPPADTGDAAPAPATERPGRSAAVAREPGEFTRMFGLGPSAAQPTTPASGGMPGAPHRDEGPAEPTPGDFTNFFEPPPLDAAADAQLDTSPRPSAPALPAIDWSAPAPRARPDGRTAPEQPEPAAPHVSPPPRASPPPPGTADLGTAVFGLPRAAAVAADSPLPAPGGSPSVYTQVVAGRSPLGPGGPAQSAGDTSPSLPPAQRVLGGRRSLVRLVVALNAIVLAAIALVLYFVLRPAR